MSRNRCKCPASAPPWPECCNFNALAQPKILSATLVPGSNSNDDTLRDHTSMANEPELCPPGGGGVGYSRGVKESGDRLSNIRPILTSIPHQPEHRVLSGEIQTSDYKLAKKQAKAMASSSISEAIRVVQGIMRTADSDKIKLDAAKFLIELVTGKPKVDSDEPKTIGSKADGLEDEILEAILEESN